MCVALPGRIVSVGPPEGTSLPALVRFGETDRHVDLAMVPEAAVGDYVIVLSGFAISRVGAAEARRAGALMARIESR